MQSVRFPGDNLSNGGHLSNVNNILYLNHYELCRKIFNSKLAVSYLPKNIQVQICRGRRKFWRQKPDIMNLVATFPDGKCAPGKFDNQPI